MRELLAGGTIVLLSLLLFGCVGGQETAETAESDIGDRLIVVTEEEEDAPLYFEEEIPEPPEPETVETTEPEVPVETPETEEPVAELSMSDIDVFDESDFDIMMTEDIIEP